MIILNCNTKIDNTKLLGTPNKHYDWFLIQNSRLQESPGWSANSLVGFMNFQKLPEQKIAQSRTLITIVERRLHPKQS